MSEFIKHHNIKFKEGPKNGETSEWESLMKEIHGLISVCIDGGKKNVSVEYDLRLCSEEAIEHWMVKTGFVLDDSLMERMKRGWIHYTEENTRDNLGSKPHSCCEVDDTKNKGSGRK